MRDPEYKTVHVVINDNNVRDLDIWEIIDPVWWTANFWSGIEAYRQSVSQFTLEQRLMVSLCTYLSDVKNGGHELYFSSAFGNFWRDAVQCLELLKLPKAKLVLQDALCEFPGIPSDAEADRELVIEKHAIDFIDCDLRFDELNSSHKIEKSMTDFAHANPESFFFHGNINRIGTSSPSSNS